MLFYSFLTSETASTGGMQDALSLIWRGGLGTFQGSKKNGINSPHFPKVYELAVNNKIIKIGIFGVYFFFLLQYIHLYVP